MIVCSCNVLSDTQVRETVSAASARTAGQVYRCLGCSPQCGRCARTKDYPSRELFEDLMEDEEGHIDFLETQLELMTRVGVELYSQHHIGKLEKIEPGSKP